MPRINLLPWREADRKQKRQEFMVGIVGAVVIAVLLGLLAKFQLSAAVDHQNERNQLINDQITEVNKQNQEIVGLDSQKQRLLARMEVIEQLQRSRPGVVHLFDQLVRTIPDGVYFTGIQQTGPKVKLSGIAQSQTRVSALMRNIEASEWLADPSLEKVETKGVGDSGAEFVLYANQTGTAPEGEVAKPRKGAAQRGKKAGVNQ
jgi:type IV pilus assembly protein PilN